MSCLHSNMCTALRSLTCTTRSLLHYLGRRLTHRGFFRQLDRSRGLDFLFWRQATCCFTVRFTCYRKAIFRTEYAISLISTPWFVSLAPRRAFGPPCLSAREDLA